MRNIIRSLCLVILLALMAGITVGVFVPVEIVALAQMDEGGGGGGGGEGGWTCPYTTRECSQCSDCQSSGCSRTSEPDGFWVCAYSGTGCPPLDSCNSN